MATSAFSINAGPSDRIAPPFDVAQRCQLSRTALVNLIDNPEMRTIVTGCFVRVLLEIEAGREDYRVFSIKDIAQGVPYSGFTNDATASTTVYIELQLPRQLHGINGSVFQLNSVSNSAMTIAEYTVWLQLDDDRSPPPSFWTTKAARLQTLSVAVPRLGRGPSVPVRPPPLPAVAAAPVAPLPVGQSGKLMSSLIASTAQLSVSATSVYNPAAALAAFDSSDAASAASGATGAVAMGGGMGLATVSAAGCASDDDITLDAAKRIVMEEYRAKYALFPLPVALSDMKTATLRTHERDLEEYLERVNEELDKGRSNCVVCMDKRPTVVSLPCKHKVLCRWCATQVHCCPVCREATLELFEPVEM